MARQQGPLQPPEPDEFREFLPVDWSDRSADMWYDTFSESTGIFYDWTAQALYHDAYFNFDLTTDQIRGIRDNLHDYMQQVYGVDFLQTFDWQRYREDYGLGVL